MIIYYSNTYTTNNHFDKTIFDDGPFGVMDYSIPVWKTFDIEVIRLWNMGNGLYLSSYDDLSCVILRPCHSGYNHCDCIYYNGVTHYIRTYDDMMKIFDELCLLVYNDNVERTLSTV